MWEEEEEQIREYGMSDSVWERLRNHPMYSPPPSPSSGKVFLISPQLYFSLPPPPSILISPTPQLHFSPPPTTSVRMSPYLDFPPPPPPRSFSLRSLFIECDTAIDTYQSLKEIIELRLQSNPSTQHARSSPRLIASTDMGEIRQCHSSRPLKRNLEDSLRDFCSTVEVALKYHVDLPWWWRPVKLNNTGDVGSLCEAVALAKPNDLEYIPLGPFLPPKSPKMVSILSYLSIVKISRKISIRLLQVLPLVQLPQTLQIVIVEEKMTQLLTCSGEFISQERQKERLMEAISPSMHEKHDSSLRCIRTPLHARSLPRTMAVLDGGEMVQLDSSKQQSLVAFDITKNSAHLVRASQSCSTISHLDETNSRETLKRKCITKSVLSFEDLQQHFSCKLDDAAKALDVSVSTVKRICRKHGIPRWPSQKKRKVSKMDCILLELQGKKDVSPTCSKMPADGQTERGNEMVAHLQDQNEGPNFLNIENGSNKESITTLISEHSVPVFEKDCILLEPQGEKNVSPTHNTPTNGQTEVGNGMVRHIQDQNGIVPEFIEGPNLSNTENRSNEKSLTSPNFQDSIPGNYLAMDFSISSTYTESGEARGSSELAFQPKELTPSMAYPNPNAFVFTQPHISLREMLIENVANSKNFSKSRIRLKSRRS
ncbi:Protein NLP9 [Camellia lanceoleosa]|uniref:Protein NLP9 n=1 Tax=Camellia lanceoleosa TaxID=1840588 RepID=A0ACC0G9E6_9ERIC|nr:Protein NLP9 [Camellia lanceoleosa]